jgi:hypothetical protein
MGPAHLPLDEERAEGQVLVYPQDGLSQQWCDGNNPNLMIPSVLWHRNSIRHHKLLDGGMQDRVNAALRKHRMGGASIHGSRPAF